MFYNTLESTDDVVGFSAPQVGILKEISVVKYTDKRYILVNPRIISAEGEQEDEEGCLSFPGVFAKVKLAE